MIVYPAIDLKDGQCVRLIRGEMDQATTFNADPADQARQFAAMGFDHLHVVDLNGAFAGTSANGATYLALGPAFPRANVSRAGLQCIGCDGLKQLKLVVALFANVLVGRHKYSIPKIRGE